MKLFLFIICTAIAALTSSAAQGAVTFQDTGDGVQRPVSVTDLTVNGIIYNVTIAYSIPINGSNTANLIGVLPDGEANDAALALRDAINAAAAATNTNSNETEIYLLSNTQPGAGGAQVLATLVDDDTGNTLAAAGDFVALLSNPTVGPLFRFDRGAATFAIPPIPPVPEPSSTVICATIAVSVMLRRRRRRRVGNTTGL